MKNKIIYYIFMGAFFLTFKLSAQHVSVNMTVFEPLPEVSFTAFLTTKGLENTPRIFQIVLNPIGENVIVKGSIQWRKVDESSFNEILSFTTKPFLSRNFYNDDLSSIDGIELEDSDSNDDLLQENLKKGKPTGTYRISVEVFNKDMQFQSSDEEEIDFLNPAQTLSILQPSVGDELDLAGILLTWTDVTGVAEFYVKANTRSSKMESLEEALQKGNPIVNNSNVGKKRSFNLREILDRELIGGEEVVVQVRASIPGPGGPTVIFSNIVNFKIRGASSAATDKGVKEFETLVSGVLDDMQNSGQGNSDVYQRLSSLLKDIENGNINFDDIKIKNENGTQLTYSEFQQILQYLRNNPELLTNLTFDSK
jgi:hypothetical protein